MYLTNSERVQAGLKGAADVADMSDISDDDDFSSRPRSRTNEGSTATRKIITALSDDESDDDVRRLSSSNLRSRRESQSRSPSPVASPDAYERRDPSPSRPLPSRPTDCYQRVALSKVSPPKHVDILHLPPSVTFPPALTTTLDDVPVEQNPILYRLRPSVTVAPDEKPADALLRELKRVDFNPLAFGEFLESNANFIEWSDGSRTLSIGNQQFLLVDDGHASQQFVFQRGDKIQTFDAYVNKVTRVQPSSTGDAHAKLVMSKAVERSRNKRGVSKTILRTMDAGAENKERQARIESQKRERERAKMEAKKRQARERYSKPSRPLSVNAIESDDEDSGEDGMRRMEEHVDANRLMRAKRPAPQPSRMADISVKRRKAGGRRVLGDDDDDDDDDSD